MDDQRVALVTGGAKRVGRAIVERLAGAGFAVAFTYNQSEAEAEALQAACGAWPIRADLSDPAGACEHIRNGFSMFSGNLDVLVHNASAFEPASLAGTNLGAMRRMMAIHYESPLLLTQSFAPMLRRDRGHVVTMVDLLAERPWPEYLAYCASKAALANLTVSLSRALAPDVTVNGISPGVVAWPEDYPAADRERYLARVPLGRPGTPADVAELVHYLVTAGSYVTGQIIRLDGGRSVT